VFERGTVYAFRDLTEEHAVEKLKSDFVATISHELRTPLAAIYGAALTLRRQDFPIASAQRETLLDVVASEADRLARIVNDILWASRLESDSMQVAIESCDGAKLLHDVASAAAAYVPSRLRIAVDAPAGVPPVAADREKVRQVLTNLVDNAIKYSPDGGSVTLHLERDGDRVRFVIRDEGLGIPPGERERIFEKFYRLDPNLTRGVGGTGLGLYICRELVRRMGGSIWTEPNGGRGSAFIVELRQAAA
jgi:signal transduction histidine kinase